MEITKYAPILIPTLNRHIHFKRCVESLSRCTHAEKTDLFIALDYPLNDSHWEGYEIIKAYVKQIGGFNTVNIIQREENYGSGKNIGEARKLIFEKYDRIILSEDDNEFSPNFLDYINKGLELFENNRDVYAICGYNYPVSISHYYKNNYFFYKTVSAWGLGTWRNKRFNIHSEINEIRVNLANPLNAIKLFIHSSSTFSNLLKVLNHNIVFGDTIIATHLFRNNKYAVFPTVSKVRNWGHDGTGINCGVRVNPIFRNQEIDINKTFDFSSINQDIKENLLIKRSIKKHFNVKLKSKIKIIINYFKFVYKNWKKTGSNKENVFASYTYKKLVKSNSRLSKLLWSNARKILVFLFNDPICKMQIFNRTLIFPLSHKLPLSIKSSAFFDSLPNRLSTFIYDRNKCVKCIDVGANVGDTIAAFFIGQENVSFLAIEPNIRFFNLLKKNWGWFENIVFLNALCSNEVKSNSYELCENAGTASYVVSKSGEILNSSKLDNIIKDYPSFVDANILKIDTDGHDFQVIKGGINYLENTMPALLFECDVFDNINYFDDISEVLTILKRIGYRNIIVYDNFGFLLGKYSLSDLTCFYKLIFYQSISKFYYFDILVIKEEMFNDFYNSELRYFIQAGSPKKVNLDAVASHLTY